MEVTTSLTSNVVMKAYRRVGRSLQAAKEFNTRDVVLCDTPVLSWSGDVLPWPASEVELLLRPRTPTAASLDVPVFFIAAAAAYCHAATSIDVRQVVSDMHVPDLPIRSQLMDLVLFCERLAERVLSESSADTLTSPHQILHAILAAKVNSHRGPCGEWRLYKFGSKFAHSCDPNCAYMPDAGWFVATRNIRRGEMLSFSYLGGPPLLQPTACRQERLLSSHLFLCQCKRCREVDPARAFRCSSCGTGVLCRVTSPLIDSQEDLFPELPWRCNVCSSGCDDDSMGSLLDAEAEISQSLVFDDLGTKSKPYKLNELVQLLQTCVSCFGRRHWLYSQCVSHLAKYFTQLGKVTRDAETLRLAWRLHAATTALHASQLCATTHMLVASSMTTTSEMAFLSLLLMGTAQSSSGGDDDDAVTVAVWFSPGDLREIIEVVKAMRNTVGTAALADDKRVVAEERTISRLEWYVMRKIGAAAEGSDSSLLSKNGEEMTRDAWFSDVLPSLEEVVHAMSTRICGNTNSES